jgi:hypothetical protein
MQEAQNWTEKYYSAEGLEALRARRLCWTPELQKEFRSKWQGLYVDIQSGLDRGSPPDSAEGRALVARWMRLCDEFTLGNTELGAGFQRLYQDESNWPDDELAEKLTTEPGVLSGTSFELRSKPVCDMAERQAAQQQRPPCPRSNGTVSLNSSEA